MPLFKVTRTLIYDLITYQANTIHEFQDSQTIIDLIDNGVLIPVTAQQEKTLKETSQKLDNKPLDEIQKETEVKEQLKTECPKCKLKVAILPKETIFYESKQAGHYTKQETCVKCGTKIPSKVNADEHRKIESGEIKLQKKPE